MTSAGTGCPSWGSRTECTEDQTGLSRSRLWSGVFFTNSPGATKLSDRHGGKENTARAAAVKGRSGTPAPRTVCGESTVGGKTLVGQALGCSGGPWLYVPLATEAHGL